ncbi:MAG: cysteine hydrolase [Firmicutes bacterium]|nr:cysteine hydrolase [Bacillota bacterium]
MKKIIILVDVQNGFVKTDYAEKSFAKIVDLLSHDLFDTVIATKYWNEPGSIISRFMDWYSLCTEEEQDLRPEIKKYVDHVVLKNTFSSMTAEMIELLKEVNDGKLPEYVFVLGFDTECCVLTTATDLFELGVRPILLAEYSGSHDGPKYHNAGLVSLEHLIGPKFIIKDDDIVTQEDIEKIIRNIM